MKGQIIGLVVLIAFLAFASTVVSEDMPYRPSDSVKIRVSVLQPILSVSVEPGEWLIGRVKPGEKAPTRGGYFKATNDGNVPEDLYISVPEYSNTQWRLGPEQGVETYTMEYRSGIQLTVYPPEWRKILPGESSPLDKGLDVKEVCPFDLQFGAPTFTEVTTEQEIRVVVTAEESVLPPIGE